ncbi:MAG TPA: acyltransferase [Verrucomicrobiae bacterium]|jgi:peptidoglycan/LPS O-acetylase OafA/YrhL
MNQSHKLHSLEGLRGIAAFIVVFHHLRLTFYATSTTDILHQFAHLPRAGSHLLLAAIEGMINGTFAVWLFWIMSGFVLSFQFFLRAHETSSTSSHDYLEDALLRRYPRLLLPVFVSVAFAFAIHALGLMHNIALSHTLGEPYESGWLSSWYAFPASALGAAKSAAWESFFAFRRDSTYNPVLWTMEMEFYGSLFLFAFLAILGHRGIRFFAYPLIAIVGYTSNLIWLNTFVAGIALCDLYVNRTRLPSVERVSSLPFFSFVRRSPIFAALIWSLIIIASGFFNYHDVPPNYRDLAYLLIGIIAIALTLVSISTQRFLSSAIPLFLGRISFGLYLIHVPVICSFSSWAYLATFPFMGRQTAALLVSIATCVLSVILGYALYVLADRPGIHLSRWLSNRAMKPSSQPDAASNYKPSHK